MSATKIVINREYYEARLKRVTVYIHDHLDDDLDLNKLADIACLSPYHWHRIYRAVFGETIAATVKRLRLHRAAEALANGDLAVADIARRCGYENVQSFTRIFAASYGLPPAQYRQHGSHTRYRELPQTRSDLMFQVEIKNLPAIHAVTLNHSGSYQSIGKTFETLSGLLHMRNMVNQPVQLVGIYYDDPAVVGEAELRSQAGVILAAENVAPPLQRTEITGGKYAVLRHVGAYSDLAAAYQWLYQNWLMQSGEQPADAPPFELYLNTPMDTAPADLITEIHIPLRSYS